MASTKRNGFHQTEWFPLKGMSSTKRNVFHQMECLPLKGMFYTKRNGLQFLLVEAIPFLLKPFLLMEAISFSANHSVSWKPFLLVEAIAFSGTVPFSKSHSFQ